VLSIEDFLLREGYGLSGTPRKEITDYPQLAFNIVEIESLEAPGAEKQYGISANLLVLAELGHISRLDSGQGFESFVIRPPPLCPGLPVSLLTGAASALPKHVDADLRASILAKIRGEEEADRRVRAEEDINFLIAMAIRGAISKSQVHQCEFYQKAQELSGLLISSYSKKNASEKQKTAASADLKTLARIVLLNEQMSSSNCFTARPTKMANVGKYVVAPLGLVFIGLGVATIALTALTGIYALAGIAVGSILMAIGLALLYLAKGMTVDTIKEAQDAFIAESKLLAPPSTQRSRSASSASSMSPSSGCGSSLSSCSSSSPSSSPSFTAS
jgi:hypothetical protein